MPEANSEKDLEMHAYLRAIGFKEIISKKKLRELLQMVIEEPDEQRLISLESLEGNVAELRRSFADGMGIIVHGYYDESGSFRDEYYIPYLEGRTAPVETDITITRHVSRESFAGVCEDFRLGATLIYYLENSMEYLDRAMKQQAAGCRGELYLSGLCTSGTVLLPISKNEKQREKVRMENLNRRKLISEARMGDEAAIESLTIEDLDTYTKISRRIHKEDVFSIVDSSFMPYGVECDQYSIIGEIKDVSECKNRLSGERIYVLAVDCNDFELSVGINADDLMGEPQVGRRFKGAIWLLGRVNFV